MPDKPTTVRLVAASSAAAVPLPLTADQHRVVDRAEGSLVVLGAAGTGKTTALVEATVAWGRRDGVDPGRMLVVAPTRQAAARLRDAVTARWATTLRTTPVRTWSAYAFDLLRRAQAMGRLPGIDRPLRLLSGPEQDVILGDLLAGHERGDTRGPAWPADLRAAVATRGFRTEIRELFDRASEWGLDARALAELGREHHVEDWVAAADLYREYIEVLSLASPEAFDAAGLIRAATDLLSGDPELLAQERESHRILAVDDGQEMNPATFELMRLLAGIDDGDGASRLLLAADPDGVVQGFRGARPDLAATLARQLPRVVLGTALRTAPELVSVRERIAARLPATAGAPWRATESVGGATDGGAPPVEIELLDSPAAERRELLRLLQAEHIHHGRPWSHMAVIVRSKGRAAVLRRYLASYGVPVQVPVAETPVRDEDAVRPLLQCLDVALHPERLTPERAGELLRSGYGGADTVAVRRLRRALRAQARAAGYPRTSDELLVEALPNPGHWAGMGGLGASVGLGAARRISAVIDAARSALEEDGATAEGVLWAMWRAADVAAAWRDQALAGGPAGAVADRNLDAVVALFAVAERYSERLPGAGPEQFLDYLADQDLPEDTLAERGRAGQAVSLLTPAGAAGLHWPLVVLSGLQEGSWPDLRVRGELLGSRTLVDVLRGAVVDHAHAVTEIWYDELHMLYSAVGRATERIVCTAVSDEEDRPSPFLDLVEPWDPTAAGLGPDTPRPVRTAGLPVSLPGLVVMARRTLTARETAPADRRGAAVLLARLARAGVPGADPGQWWGLEPLSTVEDIFPADEPVPVSPSKLEEVSHCALCWFVDAAGGHAATDLSRSLGTLVHDIAARHPEAGLAALSDELERRWPELGLPHGWLTDRERERAERVVSRLAEYIRGLAASGRRLVGTELGFGVRLGDALLQGRVDRLEADDRGRPVVVDLKTGQRAPAGKELPHHPQLGAYQAAALAGGFDEHMAAAAGTRRATGGAALVQLGSTTKSLKTQPQASLADDHAWIDEMIADAARVMRGHDFPATHHPGEDWGGHGCAVPEVCPLCAKGRQVTEL